MDKRFIFIDDEKIIKRLKQKSTESERRTNMLYVSGKFFGSTGYLINQQWLTSKDEGDIYETGIDGISYSDLCKFGKEYESLYGSSPSVENEDEYIDYHIKLTQYCIDKADNIIQMMLCK